MKTKVSDRAQAKVSSLTVAELRLLIQETVAETIEFMLPDPDEGKVLRPEVEQRLRESLEQAQAGEQQTIPLSEAAKKLGLDWE